MDFRLVYSGLLRSTGNDVESDRRNKALHKFQIRQQFHPQLKELRRYPPINNGYGLVAEPTHLALLDPADRRCWKTAGPHKFVCLVRRELRLTAELDVIFLRREYSGALILKGGDLDNRLKTLFDALRMPQQQEIPLSHPANPDEDPLFCLLEDDALITKISVTADTWLDSTQPADHVHLMMHVKVVGPDRAITNIGEIG